MTFLYRAVTTWFYFLFDKGACFKFDNGRLQTYLKEKKITYLKDDQQVAKATKEKMYCIIFPPFLPPMQDRASLQKNFSQTGASEDFWPGSHGDMTHIIHW